MSTSQPRRTNCVAWAIALWWRRRKTAPKGARVYFPIARWSDWGPFWHVLYTERSRHGRVWVVSYKPSGPRKRKLPPPLFVGRVVFGDAR